jgi:hypothetical protein
MALRPIFANVLPNLNCRSRSITNGPISNPDQQRRQAREHAAKRDVAKDPEEPEIRKQLLIQQPIEQSARLAFNLILRLVTA